MIRNEIEFFIPGPPVGKERARVARSSGIQERVLITTKRKERG